MFVHELLYRGEPDALAIVDHDRRLTYRDIQEGMINCRNRLYAVGIRRGDRVGIFSRNSAEYVMCYMAIASLGAISVPINFQLSNREIAYIIKDAGIRHLLTYQPLNLVDAMAAMHWDRRVYQHDIRLAMKKKAGLKNAPELPADFDENNPCVIIYTSGTTGSPKGAVLSHRNLCVNASQMRVMGAGPEQKSLCVLPMYHCFGWTCSILYPLFCGGSIVILDSFTPKETIEVIRTEKINDLYIVPSICSLLTKLGKPEDMASLRLVVSGGTTLPLKIAEDFRDKFGITIVEGYGLSEASPVTTLNPRDKSIIGSIGKLLPGIECRFLDSDGHDVPKGENGELVIRGGNVMLGYWNLPDATKNALRGGWLHTGDVAHMDDEGYIFIVDRLKDMIISMGENIYPREVEELIYRFPGIDEAAVIGIEDRLRGQAGACFYSVHEGDHVNIRELKKFLQANLALFKIPREFHQLDRLPRTTTGKIAKRQILKDFMASKDK